MKMDRGRSRSPRRDRGDRKERKTKRGPPEKRVFVSNLPFDMKWQEVKDLFRKEVGEVSYVELFDDESGKPRGAGVMEFNTVELTKKAIDKMHRYEFKGRKIVVKEDFDVERDKCGRIITSSSSRRDDRMERGGGGGGGGGGGSGLMDRSRGADEGGHGYTYGLSPQFLDSLNINCPIHNRIFVANLDYKVDEKKLKEVFRIAGKVLGVELSRDKDGKSRGFATVVYDHPVESVQAISMFNNQQLFDRKMNVRFDKVPDEDPPTNLNRLPDGLRNIGMGLGQDGMPLLDVRANLPSPSDSGSNNIGNNNMGNMVTGLGNNSSSMLNNVGNQMNNANNANVGQQALQTALATIMAMGMGGNNTNNMANNSNSMSDNGMGNMNIKSEFGNKMDFGNNSGSSSMGLGMGGGNMDRMGSAGPGLLDLPSSMSGMSGMSGSSSSFGGFGGSMSGSGMSGGGMLGGGMQGGGFKSERRSDAILVRNLPLDCTWQMLKDKFYTVGDIKYAEMKDRGVGVIR